MRGIAILLALAALAVACEGARPTTPAVTPSPSPPAEEAAPRGCGLPPGGPFQHCPVELPVFNFEINDAIAEVENEVPQLFDFNDWQGGLSYRVTDRARYHEEIVIRLEKMGFCAVFDGEEVGIKKDTNDFNEQYQVMTSLGYVRWGAGAYRSTCFPAWF